MEETGSRLATKSWGLENKKIRKGDNSIGTVKLIRRNCPSYSSLVENEGKGEGWLGQGRKEI